MKGLHTIAEKYQEKDIYNMNETELYWKMMLSYELSSQVLSELKKNKVWITIALCVNSTESDHFSVWIIGKSKTSQTLQYIDVTTMGAVWCWNKKAWMNTVIIIQWLQTFYQHIDIT